MRIPLLLASVPLAITVAASARAQDPAAAQALFEEGKRLVAQNQVEQGCKAFEESQRLDPGIGTLYHLADCHARLGKTATAYTELLQVAAEADAHGERAREAAARQQAAELEPKVARLTIDPGADRGTPGLEVLRDGAPLAEGEWGAAVPTDPGPHTIEVRAPGHGTWRSLVNVTPGTRQLVTVPLLAVAPPAPPTAAAPVPTGTTTTTGAEVDGRPSRGNAQRAVGITLASLGVVGAGVGTYFGVVAMQRHNDAAPHCVADVCDPTGASLRQDAIHAGNASTVAFIAGGAAIVGGLVTFFTAPREAAPASGATRASPQVAIGPSGVSVRGAW